MVDFGIIYAPMQKGEEKAVMEVVLSTFHTFVAPAYSAEGVEAFRAFAHEAALKERCHNGDFVFTARNEEGLVGILEMRECRHVALFFVHGVFQGRGIGRNLLALSVEECRKRNRGVEEITVNASPNAVEAYRKMGFLPQKEEQQLHGIRFVPMVLRLQDQEKPR